MGAQWKGFWLDRVRWKGHLLDRAQWKVPPGFWPLLSQSCVRETGSSREVWKAYLSTFVVLHFAVLTGRAASQACLSTGLSFRSGMGCVQGFPPRAVLEI